MPEAFENAKDYRACPCGGAIPAWNRSEEMRSLIKAAGEIAAITGI